jgi:hypothetical protein
VFGSNGKRFAADEAELEQVRRGIKLPLQGPALLYTRPSDE